MTNHYLIEPLQKHDIPSIDTIISIEKELEISILSKASILQDLQDPHFQYFVVKTTTKQIVGYLAISLVIDTIDLLSIVVKKDYQNQGIASSLLDYVIQLAKKEQIKHIMLEVRKSNIVAQNLYTKFQFKQIAQRKNYYQNPIEDAFIYERLLDE